MEYDELSPVWDILQVPELDRSRTRMVVVLLFGLLDHHKLLSHVSLLLPYCIGILLHLIDELWIELMHRNFLLDLKDFCELLDLNRQLAHRNKLNLEKLVMLKQKITFVYFHHLKLQGIYDLHRFQGFFLISKIVPQIAVYLKP